MMVSGMSVGEDTADQLALQLFLDLVTGQLGSDEVKDCLRAATDSGLTG